MTENPQKTCFKHNMEKNISNSKNTSMDTYYVRMKQRVRETTSVAHYM